MKGTTTEANQPVQQDTPTGKELAADALDRIASKLGGKKSIVTGKQIGRAHV